MADGWSFRHIKRKKKSLPIILSLNSRNKSATENINKIMLKQELEDNDVNDVMNIMDELKIKNKCEEISKNYQHNIEKTIEKLPIENNQKKIFNEISEFLISREN